MPWIRVDKFLLPTLHSAMPQLCNAVATFITLSHVPVLYSIFVRDLKTVKWARPASGCDGASTDTKGELH